MIYDILDTSVLVIMLIALVVQIVGKEKLKYRLVAALLWLALIIESING